MLTTLLHCIGSIGEFQTSAPLWIAVPSLGAALGPDPDGAATSGQNRFFFAII